MPVTIRISDLPPTAFRRRTIRSVVEYNMAPTTAHGKGNKARRRQGLHVKDSTKFLPYQMGAGEIAALLRSPNP